MPSNPDNRPIAVTRDDAGLHAEEVHPGLQSVVFLHGVGRDRRTFAPLAGRLGELWNPWLLDFRGHGRSPRGADVSLVADHVRDLRRWLIGRWQRPVVLYGHSLGAMVATAMAAAEPDLVAALVLEDPPFQTMGDRIHGSFWEHYFRGLHDLLATPSPTPLVERLAAIPIPSPTGGWVPLGQLRDAASLRFGAECLSTVDPEVFRSLPSGRWLEGYDVPANIGAIRCPVFLIQGDPALGSALTDEDARRFDAVPGGCQRIRIPGKGHLMHWPSPDPVLPIFDDLATMLRIQPGR